MKPLGIAVSLLFLPLLTLADETCNYALDAHVGYEATSFYRAWVTDFDGDGVPDVIASQSDELVLGRGRGAGRLDIRRLPSELVYQVADVTGDARPDLIGRVVRENRDGAFVPVLDLGSSFAAAVADFTNDGRADLLLYNNATQVFSLREGGTLAEKAISIRHGNYSLEIFTGDVDGDGNLDLVSRSLNAHRILIEYGDGDGNFPRREERVVDGLASILAVADFNVDGKADVLFSTAPGGTQIMYGGSAAAYQVALTDGGNTTVADLNGDSIPDLLFASSNGAHPYLNDGHAHFTLADDIRAIYSASVGDVTNDGIPDLVVATEFGFVILAGHGDGSFDTRRRDVAQGSIVARGDVDGDGLDEVLIHTPEDELVALSGDGHSETLPVSSLSASIAPNREVLIRRGDVLTVVARRGDGTWSIVRTLTRPTLGAFLADLNGDGANELVLAEPQGDQVFVKVINDTSDTELFRVPVTARPGYAFAVGDANEDGKLDLFVAARGTFSSIPHTFINRDGYLDVFFGQGGDTFDGGHRLAGNESFSDPIPADFNGDGHLDVADLAQADSLGLLYVLTGDGTGAFTTQTPIPDDPYLSDIDVADVNGDGIDDLGAWLADVVTIYLGTPDGLVRRERYWLEAYAGDTGVLARWRAGAPPSALSDGLADQTVTELAGLCAPQRRRGVRH